LYDILLEYPGNLVGLIKMCLNETYSAVRIGKYQSDEFPIQNGLKQRSALSSLFFSLALGYAIRGGPREPGRAEIEWDTPAFGLY
jgi:hypothetical protein